MGNILSTFSATCAIAKIPVEIWISIFRLVLGPSLSDPYQSSLQAYTIALFTAFRTFELYKSREQRRGRLRRVCRYWKNIADALDDRLVVICPDGFTWPRGQDPKGAKRVFYFWVSNNPTCLVDADRMKTANWQPKERGLATYQFPSPIDPTAYIAPAMDIINCLMDIPEDAPLSICSNTSPKSLYYQYYGNHENPLRGLWHPLFRHLTALHLRVDFPFYWTYPLDHLTLPELRYLYLDICLRLSSLPHDRVGTSVLTWRFPKLQILGLCPRLEYRVIEREISVLLAAHAGTLEELELFQTTKGDVTEAVEWSKFTVLKRLHISSLHLVHRIIPALLGNCTGSDPSSSESLLEVHFAEAWLRRQEFLELELALQHYPHAFARVKFCLDVTWNELADTIRGSTEGRDCILSPSLRMESLNVVDIEGQALDSPAGLRALQVAR